MGYPIPTVKITLDGQDISGKIFSRFSSLELTECRGGESDMLALVLSDADGMLAIPPKGAKINVQFGWADSGLVDKGLFTVDEVEHTGTPDVLTLHARTASFLDTFKQVQESSFNSTTLGAIIEAIAFRNELQVGIADALRNVAVKHIDQTRESDAAFLRRLGKKYDAVATIKNDTLIFVPAGRSKTASGKALPVIKIVRQLGDQHRYQSAERDSYTGVRAYWHDDTYLERRSVVAGTPGNSKRLRTTYASEADARAVAVAEWQRIQRGLATFELSLALGDPTLMPESPVVVSGFKSEIDSVDWVASKVRSRISKSGFTSSIEMETRTEEAEVEREDATDRDPGITGVIAKWRNKVSKKQGEQLAGSRSNPKSLSRIYANKQSAAHAAKLEWEKIRERREIIADNGVRA